MSDGLVRDTRPYWKRAHHDWRFWVGMCFMFAALAIYILSDDLAFLATRIAAGKRGSLHFSGNLNAFPTTEMER